MRHIFLIALLTTFASAQAATPAPTKTTTPGKTVTKPAAKSTRPAPVTKPAPPKEESFFDNLSYGVILISQSVDITVDTGTTSATGSESGSGIGIYADKFVGGKYRYNGTLSYVSYDDFAITSLTVGADYLMPMSSSFALFGGVAAGGAGQKYSDAGFGDMALGLVYGVQLGGIMFVSDNLMLELGYRLRLTNLETEITTPAATATIDELSETYLSLVLSF